MDTKIIEGERIAYLRFYHFARWPNTEEQNQLDRFYVEIEGFEHLIIDIRSNPGGWVEVFDNAIRPLLKNNLFAIYHHFFMDGEYNLHFFSILDDFIALSDDRHGNPFYVGDIGQTHILYGRELLPHVLEDLSQFNYSAIGTRRVDSVHPIYENWHFPFQGKVWMLVDENVFSAANQVAAFYKDAGFVTLVGETTGGISGSPAAPSSNYFVLPNTGIIIRYDPAYVTTVHGRPLEYGIEPHIFNRPGMDALETVLALINEEAYE